MADRRGTNLTRTVLKRAARCAAATVLLVTSYLASAPVVVVTTKLRAPASQANFYFYWYYLPALAYPSTDLPGSTLYDGYYESCARRTANYWES